MDTVVKAEYIREKLCQKCFASHHEEPSVEKPFRKVVEHVRGVMICTNCGRRVNRGYVVVYERIRGKAVS
jgi:hypothetical protein